MYNVTNIYLKLYIERDPLEYVLPTHSNYNFSFFFFFFVNLTYLMGSDKVLF